MDHCTLWPEGNWAHCCVVHDQAYDDPLLARLAVDIEFGKCVADAAGWPLATLMLCGVVMFGWMFRRVSKQVAKK